MKIAVVALTVKGRLTAKKIKMQLEEVEIYLPQKLADGSEDYTYTRPFAELFGELFTNYRYIICIMATGIVVRSIEGLLKHKSIDPAIVVVDDGGRFAISLIGGHLAGANELAEKVAKALNGQAVITTASDNQDVISAEMWGKKFSLTLEDFAELPAINGAIVNGGRIAVISQWEVPVEARILGQQDNTDYFLFEEENTFLNKYDVYVYVTDKLLAKPKKPSIILRPKTLVAGMGMRRGVGGELIHSTLSEALLSGSLASAALKCLASIDVKQDEVGLLKTAENLHIPCYFYNKEKLQEMILEQDLMISPYVKRQMGVGAVCEPAALAVVKNSKLIVPKYIAHAVTVAIARVPFTW